MVDEEALHRCVTKFMIDTCRYSTSEYAKEIPFFRRVSRVALSDVVGLVGDAEWFMSGSTAEFRIKPMLSCIGDIDIMAVLNNALAIPHGYTPPTELPGHYQTTVYVFEIIDSRQPGYVYLWPSYILKKANNGRYPAEKVKNKHNRSVYVSNAQQQLPQCISNVLCRPGMISRFNKEFQNNSSIHSLLIRSGARHGPAFKYNYNANQLYKPTQRRLSLLSIDSVPCLRCLHWPPQSSYWPTRHRDHHWPDQTTINIVVSNGCDVVDAVHPQTQTQTLL